VGREREMEEVKRKLAITRLLTLTGVGGSGKTRLALEVARDLIEAYPHGVWLVELAPLSEAALVPKAVAEALEVTERPVEPLAETLAEVFRDRQLLLILDNCEHLLEATARLADVLLDSCPRLRIMATSREALGIEGEVRWLVPALSVPEPQGKPSPEELEGYESVRLFVERAKARDPSFFLSPKNALAVTEICRRLEGIPLAIELAAARVGTLSLEQISQRLKDSLKLLTGGSKTQMPKQRTLRGALDWSYELLSEEEKKLFARLSVFVGGWTLEASEAAGAGGGVEEEDILDVHSGLVDKSLVVVRGCQESGVRYSMLESTRQYAREKLEEGGEGEEVRRRHAGFFLDLAEEAEPRLRGPEDTEWLERLEVEHDNLRAALSWALEQEGADELGLRLAGALWLFWEARGYYGEGHSWLEQVLAKGGQASAAARAKALEGVGWLVFRSGGMDEGVIAAREGLELSDEAGLGGAVRAKFLNILSWVALLRGDNERAKELFEECLKLSRDASDELGIADALLGLANALHSPDYRKREKELFEEGIVLCRKLGYVRTLASHLFSLGFTLLLEGDYERGAALNEEAATLLRERGYKGGLEFVLDNLGWAALLQGDHERAKNYYEENLALCKELGDKTGVAGSLEGLACVAGTEGEAERAAKLFGVADVLCEAVGYQHMPEEDAWREPYRAAARSLLGEVAWEEALAQGHAMGLEEAIEYALSKGESSAIIPSSTPEHPAGLTSREVEVLGMVAAGMTNAQTAKELFVSTRTVETHLTSIYHKLGVSSRAAATRFALEHDLG
jgi:predicted ATPase/DNA-binding CsgD family transcriptional regulator